MLVKELASYTHEFETLDKVVEKRIATFRSRLPISDELTRQSYGEVITGQPFEPLMNQRKPKKQETIVAVHEVSLAPGKTYLVFEAADGTLWQLCDAGLGWTFYSSVGEAWKPAERFSGLLPARINPRPKMDRRWNYEIPFGKSATLVVRPGKEPNSIQAKIKRA